MVKFCSLFSGSSGNALFLGTDRLKLLIDAGLSAGRIMEALCSIDENPGELDAVLISHEHSDHIRGAGIISRKFNIPIYANELTWEAMEQEIGPVKFNNRKYFNTGTEFAVGDVWIHPFHVPHDAAQPVGFSFYAGDRKITTATDIGHVSKELLKNIEHSDLLLLESNHDLDMLKKGPYPWFLKKRIMGDRGHLSNEMAGKAVAYMVERGARRFLLGHLSKANNVPELAYRTVFNELLEKNLCAGNDLIIDIALRDSVGKIYEI